MENVKLFIKKLVFGECEPYKFNHVVLKFKSGSRPVRRKYIDADNDIVRNDVLQINYFESNFQRDDIL